ncbi:MAG: hypothetical protein DRO23_12570 [Thermoprotei archaeon]|nr:MAG: hypothetical protein DRO23_12570 [Thermoprotei archaeon]
MAAAAVHWIRTAGTIVQIDPRRFIKVANKFRDKGIVIVHSVSGVISKRHVYTTGIHGIVFFCETTEKLSLTVDFEAKSLYF